MNQGDAAQVSWARALEEAERRAQNRQSAEEIKTTPEELRELVPEVHMLLAKWYEANGDTKKALDHWSEAANSGMEPYVSSATEALNRLLTITAAPLQTQLMAFGSSSSRAVY